MNFTATKGAIIKVSTGIICTMGPSMRSINVLKKMSDAGMTVIRFNFSHGSYETYEKDFELVKTLNKEYGSAVKILADLEGHRIRVGNIKNGKVELKKSQKLVLTNKKILGDDKIISIDYANTLTDIKPGLNVFIDDGNLTLKVLCSKEEEVITEVQNNYILKTNKGVNIPKAKLTFQPLEEKDREHMLFALEYGVDFIANSFVRNTDDMKPLIDILEKKNNKTCKLIAKIEDISGIENLTDIIECSNGIMVARGDLGISIPLWTIPIIQKHIITQCKAYGKFAITATQMLESMIINSMPTRAEVSDVANAILDGTSYVMLSAETAVGNYPCEAVKMMNNIIKFTKENSCMSWDEIIDKIIAQ
ncbi:MAG: pyruvate kinase [Endomicrobium sp.]|jgi:pyruvate kinase|nr:pyruvate kinase [Endomicrobium sp.]